MTFLFPFQAIKKGSSIVLYGIGVMGRDFYYQNIATNYCNIIGWTDTNLIESGDKKQYPFCGKEQLEKLDYDCILVAVESPALAWETIIPYLISLGIDEKKIVYQASIPAYPEMQENYYNVWSIEEKQKTKLIDESGEICNRDVCTGCMACVDECQHDAIEIYEDEYGFKYPRIIKDKCLHCGRCEKVCLQNPKNNRGLQAIKKSDNELIYAIAPEKYERIGSSGGIFPLIATQVLDRGGIVYGAEFDQDFNLLHIGIEKTEQLEPLCRSKYTQSDASGVYKKIKDYLASGREVLFCGTPCQVAALDRSIKGEQREKLITIDLFCHGVLSNRMLRDCISDYENLSEVETVRFRDKSDGWRASVDYILVKNNNGEYKKIGKEYMHAFLKNWALRPSCYQCGYRSHSRVGDLSLGDGWSSLNEPNRAKSIISINTKKGKALIEENSNELEIKSAEGYAIGMNSTRMFPVSDGDREYFRDLYKVGNKSFKEIVNKVIANHYDVAIVGGYHWSNYGDEITYYALYALLKSWGYDVLMVNWSTESQWWTRRKPLLFNKCPYPLYSLNPTTHNDCELQRLNDQVDCFVVGSGIYFHPQIIDKTNHLTLLEWVDKDKPKIGYSIAWGIENLDDWKCETHRQRAALSTFQALGVREKSGHRIATDIMNIDDVKLVVDPVFLAPQDAFDRIITKEKPASKYNYAYILDNMNPEVRLILEELTNYTSLPNKIVTRYGRHNEYSDWKNVLPDVKLEEWFSHFINSEYIVTDSFHGMCLCIRYHKQFSVYIGSKEWAQTRILGLLKELDLSDRVVESFDDIKNNIEKPIDYKRVDKIIKKLVESSKSWLRNEIIKALKV
ncbi:polysaccharide pyruvyl transferase family protein [Eubacterium xylanophilum]|uniref:polysaccharide pyruvyl transferase family protein n=1 Tax=Eubacterium xylanophilum TaxID=39497 RepID=UPI00047B3F58|nr:polysaccharide pyruvyl transferase family protein [Eubacterium xylanophilum]